MTKVQFQTARNVLRWAGIGAMVSAQRVDEALHAVSDLPRNDERADSVRAALVSLRGGVMLPQRECFLAEKNLEIFFERQQDQDVGVERDHG